MLNMQSRPNTELLPERSYEWNKIFEPYNVTPYEYPYDTFKGSRNLRERNNKVIEIMYLISKKE